MWNILTTFKSFLIYFSLLKVVEDGYEFFAKRQLVTLFSAPNYCGEFDNAGAMMSVDDTLMCSFQVRYVLWMYLVYFFFLIDNLYFLTYFIFIFIGASNLL